ncbi:MAG: hypothetical protein KA401_05305 [Anaerolineae bacterium]|nr:hypothetical protein [Chloroflexota bacterium]MBP6298743.1 hypothetical protein [Anaerolineae bacterium]
MPPTTPVQQLVSSLYTAASVLVGSVTDPEVIAAAPLRHRVAALSAVSQLIGTLHKMGAFVPDAAPSPEPPPPAVITPEPPVESVQHAAPRMPAVSDYYDGWMSAEETREVEQLRRMAAQAYAEGADYAGRFLDPANDPALRLTARPVPVRTR